VLEVQKIGAGIIDAPPAPAAGASPAPAAAAASALFNLFNN